MTGVVSAYKECLKQLKEMQDLSCLPEAVVAGYSRVATKCHKLQQEQHQLPPKATWKRAGARHAGKCDAYDGLRCGAAKLVSCAAHLCECSCTLCCNCAGRVQQQCS
jgi:hypothetical protein